MKGTFFNSNKLGAAAAAPTALSLRAWWAIFKRVWTNSGIHHVGLMAAGIAFYAFLSFVPLLGAFVLIYGLFADAAEVAEHMKFIMNIVPVDAARLIDQQLVALVETATGKKGLGLLIALTISIVGASRASSAIIEALNVIYEETDRRSFLRNTLVSAVLVLAAIFVGFLGIVTAAVLGLADNLFEVLGGTGAAIAKSLTWVGAGVLCSFTLGAMYRYAPHRSDARWQWLSVGAVTGTVLWLLGTLLFGLYAANFGHYDATYGSLGAVVVLLMWLYVSAYAVLLGGLVNAETERQTARDTTTGVERPMGQRGAVMADTSAAQGATCSQTGRDARRDDPS